MCLMELLVHQAGSQEGNMGVSSGLGEIKGGLAPTT